MGNDTTRGVERGQQNECETRTGGRSVVGVGGGVGGGGATTKAFSHESTHGKEGILAPAEKENFHRNDGCRTNVHDVGVVVVWTNGWERRESWACSRSLA